MNSLNRLSVASILAALFIAAPAVSQADPVAKAVSDYTIFLDPPTGFVFVKLPAGWKFVGKVDVNNLAKLPDGVVTDLLTDSAYADKACPVALRPKR